MKNFQLISYLGGCAGDLLAATFNGIRPAFAGNHHSVIENKTLGFSMKLEDLDLQGFIEACQNRSWPWISTHEYRTLVGSGLSWINLVSDDLSVQEACVMRQMLLQHVTILIEPHSSWYKIVSAWCQAHKFDKAANYWFEHSKKLWFDEMQDRKKVQDPKMKMINIDKLFEKSYTDSLIEQSLQVDRDLLRHNHNRWLERNPKNKLDKTQAVTAVAQRLSRMDWTQKQGWISSQ